MVKNSFLLMLMLLGMVCRVMAVNDPNEDESHSAISLLYLQKQYDDLLLIVSDRVQRNPVSYNIIGTSTVIALLGAGATALYNKISKKRVSKAKVAAALWVGTAVTMACYCYGPTLCPYIFGGTEE